MDIYPLENVDTIGKRQNKTDKIGLKFLFLINITTTLFNTQELFKLQNDFLHLWFFINVNDVFMFVTAAVTTAVKAGDDKATGKAFFHDG